MRPLHPVAAFLCAAAVAACTSSAAPPMTGTGNAGGGDAASTDAAVAADAAGDATAVAGADVPARADAGGPDAVANADPADSGATDALPSDVDDPDASRADGEPADTAADSDPADLPPSDVPPADVPPADVAPTDVPPADVPPTDVPPTDVPPTDVPPADLGPTDTGPTDAGPADSGPVDTGPADTGPKDSGPQDTGPIDVPAPDVGPCGPAACDDGNPCTIDTCKPDGLCVWATQPNLPCSDGNACTVGDACNGLKCTPGTGALPCDDKNGCTKDSCDPKAGCQNAAIDGACDDGDKCTVGDKCSAGGCKGAATACDDGKPCTDDLCDKASGGCSWQAKTGPCDDGNPCTAGESCANGACAGGAPKVCDDKNVCTTDTCDPAAGCKNSAVAGTPPCDDGSVCTTKDACSNGVCTGPGVVCDDGNACTDDSCDPNSGQCTFVANVLPCVGADKCKSAGQCKNGQCQAGTAPKPCDDKNACTADSCDAATGACVFKPANDGAPCDDGLACSKESKCAGGGCKPTSACLLFADSFECLSQPTFAVVVPPPSGNHPPRKVMWAVDQVPAVAALNGMGCSLNFNDGVDYCDQIGFDNGTQQCQLPLGTATSPLLDFAAVPALVPRMVFDTYYDVDNTSATDTPRIRVIQDGTGTELKNHLLPKNNSDLKVLKKGMVVPLPEAQGKKVRIELSLQPTTSGQSQGNSGVGWFVDNLVVEAVVGEKEVCGNGADDDFNGLADCADPACKNLNICQEQCADGKDNDADGAVDCADSDCANSVTCLKPLYRWGFDACPGAGWAFSPATAGVAWAVDATPDIGPLPQGACTLNFNNGKNYCSTANCQNAQVVSGSASLQQPFDLPAGKKLTLSALVWLSTEDPNGNGAGFDNTWLEVSTTGFACAQGQNCPSQNNPYSAGTVSYQLPRDQLKTWVVRQVDISAVGGKTATLRVRFNSVDGLYNDYAGPFLDEIKVHAQ